MPLYNSKVVKAGDAEKVALDYKARDIRKEVTAAEVEFDDMQKHNKKSAFRMDPILAKITGHAAIQDEKIKTEVEKLALEKLKEIEESAYKEAYELGFKEGTEAGIKDSKLKIEEKIFQLEKETDQLANLYQK